MRPTVTAEDVYAVCENIAEGCALATARNAYGDGYRAAAERIAAEIRARRTGREPFVLERELHDAEVEARTFARVVDAAVRIVEEAGPQTAAADAIRSLVASFFSEEDLPPALRMRDRASGTKLSDQVASRPKGLARTTWERSTGMAAAITRR